MSEESNTLSKLNTIDKGVLFMLASALISALNGAVAKILSDKLFFIEIFLVF